MVAVVVDVTGCVVTENLAVLAPTGTITVVGTIAYPLFEDTVTTSPPGPAGPFKVTVAVETDPLVTELGERVTLVTATGTTETVAVWLLSPIMAVMLPAVELPTPEVVTANFTVVAPDGTVTVDGTLTQATLEERLTTTPYTPAAAPKVTEPVAPEPPIIVEDESETLLTVAALMVKKTD